MRLLNPQVLSLLLLFPVATSPLRAEDGADARAEDVTSRLVRALSEFETLAGAYTVSIQDDSAADHKRLNAANRQTFRDWKTWRVDRRRDLQLLDGQNSYVYAGDWNYHRQVYCWDGRDHVAYHGKEDSALINGNPWDTFRAEKSPAVLLGDNLFGDFKTKLSDILQQGAPVSLEGESTIVTDFPWSLSKDDPDSHRLKVTVDVNHDCLPKEILIEDLHTNQHAVRVMVDHFTRKDGGKWTPTRGRLTNYRFEPIVDEALKARAENASPEEIRKLQKQVQFRRIELGVGTMHFRLDAKTLRVNPEFGEADFRFSIPRSARTWDPRKDVL
jgi:hypothetical protein